MGTNYYWNLNICEHCKRMDRLHVGKQSSGWSFHFRGHRNPPEVMPSIISITDWAKVFKTTTGILTDEYDRVVEDPLKFLATLERPSVAQQESEDSPSRLGGSPPNPAIQWRDPEGFTFYDGEFS